LTARHEKDCDEIDRSGCTTCVALIAKQGRLPSIVNAPPSQLQLCQG